jgi:hypothetical protein
MSSSAPSPLAPPPGAGPTVRCPGCGSVLPPVPGDDPAPAGVSAACRGLFEQTVRSIRAEAAGDPSAAAIARLADDAYAAQHPAATGDGEVQLALDRLAARLGGSAPQADGDTPTRWGTAVSDVAADLDVIDLLLVETWARGVLDDWRGRTMVDSAGTPALRTERS